MILKPSQAEGKITLTQRQRAKKLTELFNSQFGICACGCGRAMSREWGYFESAELDHIVPEPAGCAKRDNDENLRALRHECNVVKGSRRI